MNNNILLNKQLEMLGLSADEIKVYVELLKDQRTHLELARITGVNRTKVYRIAEDLQKRSLISKQTDDRGTFLIATDPSTLEVSLANQEEKLKKQRAVFDNLLPQLNAMKESGSNVPGFFEVNTYEGIDGFKQMLWHELKAEGEALIFGSGQIKDLVGGDQRWAERHREMTVAAGYTIREIVNEGKKPDNFTKNQDFKKVFIKKSISEDELLLDQCIVIYNNTVAVYHWRQDEKVGFEVINDAFTAMWRNIFELYWKVLEK